jgi:TRAP-type mannitol/chloroaromatic compound transport system substrate-binding protein
MRQINAWLQAGGGREALAPFFAGYNMVSIPAGNTGAQMGGWFRKEIKTVQDLNGLKMRIGGFAGNVLQKLGAVPQQIAGGDIYPALEKGTIDAAEWIGPYDDEKLGFQRVAPYYYYPGWWEGALNLSFYVGKAKWEELPQQYKDALESACRDSTIETMAKYDVQNPQALRRLVAAGTQLRPFPREVMQACYKAAFELYDETAAKNENFRKVYEPWKVFRDSQFQWFRVAESTFDNFVYFMHAQEQQQRR